MNSILVSGAMLCLLLLCRGWHHIVLRCLFPGIACVTTSILSLLGLMTDPRLTWRYRVVLALLLHPMNFLEGFVTTFFSLVDLPDVVNRPMCPKLIQMAVLSQWGITASTLAISLGRSTQFLLNTRTWTWPAALACFWETESTSLLLTIFFVLAVHGVAGAMTYFSLPEGFGQPTGPKCVEFFTEPEIFPHKRLGYCIVGTVLLLLASSLTILIFMRRARRLGTVFIAQVRSLSRDHAFSRPPDDNSHLQVRHQLPAPNPVQNLVSSEHAHLASDLSPLGRGARLREHTTQENENQEAESLSNENTSASNEAHQRRRDDFYDYEHTRHRAQSPPPLPVNQVQPINQAPLVDQISVANQPQAAPYSNAVGPKHSPCKRS